MKATTKMQVLFIFWCLLAGIGYYIGNGLMETVAIISAIVCLPAGFIVEAIEDLKRELSNKDK